MESGTELLDFWTQKEICLKNQASYLNVKYFHSIIQQLHSDVQVLLLHPGWEGLLRFQGTHSNRGLVAQPCARSW